MLFCMPFCCIPFVICVPIIILCAGMSPPAISLKTMLLCGGNWLFCCGGKLPNWFCNWTHLSTVRFGIFIRTHIWTSTFCRRSPLLLCFDWTRTFGIIPGRSLPPAGVNRRESSNDGRRQSTGVVDREGSSDDGSHESTGVVSRCTQSRLFKREICDSLRFNVF